MQKKQLKINPKISIPLFLSIVVVGFLYVFFFSKNDQVEVPVVVAEEPAKKIWYSELDGTEVASEDKRLPVVLGIMTDNHPDARPQQAGLSQARVVYEALAEGGITRYLAIYKAEDTIKKAGPVRSARPYFLDWIREYGNSTYWHSGGSPEALEMIKRLSLSSTNEFFNGQYYWRDHKYYAPHNLYTSHDLWTKLLARRESNPEVWKGWLFEAESLTASTSVKGVSIKYSYDYRVSWQYSEGSYIRFINGKQHTDAGKQIAANTVIVQEVPTQIVDDVGRKDLETVGKGAVRIFKNGTMVRGTWEKISPVSRTRWYDENGKEIPLSPGQIWVQVVPLNPSLEITS